MKKFSMIDLAALVIWLLPIVYILFVYSSLPAIVPLHFGVDGKPNGFGTKNKFLIFQLMMTGIAAGVYLLMKYLPAIDPKKQVKYGEATFSKVAIGMLVFLSALSIVITLGTINNSLKANKLILPIIGLLFAFLGNIMNSIKPNYFIGVRVPWTLEDEANWRATHRLAGKLWFTGGILITVLVLFLPDKIAELLFLPFVFVMSIVPIIYSFVYFKKHQVKN